MLKQGTEMLLSAGARSQQGPGWHMHDGDHMFGHAWGWGASLGHALLWLLVIAAVVITTIVFTRRLGGGSSATNHGRTALDRLDERYADGEMDREEYLQRKKDILDR